MKLVRNLVDTTISIFIHVNYRLTTNSKVYINMPRRRKNVPDKSKDSESMPEQKKYSMDTAFGIPLRPRPIIQEEKSINLRPNKLNVGGNKVQLRPGVQQQLEQQMVKGKNNFQKVDKTFKKTTQRPTSTSNRETTSTPNPTTDVTSSSNYKDTTMAKKSERTTPPGTTNRGSSGGYRGTTGPGRDDRLPKDRSTYPAEHTEFNAADTGSGYYQPDPTKDIVPFRVEIPDTTYLDPNETSNVTGNAIRHNLCLNLSSFYSAMIMGDSQNPVYEARMVVLYNRMAIDVLNATKGSLSNDFTYANFKAAMLATCRLLEIYYCLDANQSIIPTHSTVLETNRTVESYCQYFKTGEMYELRSKMANTIRSAWFPPNFSAMIRWFFQFYKTGNLSQSPAFKYVCAEEFLVVNGELKGGADAMKNLVNNACAAITTNARIYAILANVYPTGAINSLPSSAGKMNYDVRMEEILVNDSLIYVEKHNGAYPAGSDRSCYPMAFTISDTAHNNFTYIMNRDPHLKSNDGLAFVMQSIIKTSAATGNAILPGSVWIGIRRNLQAVVDDYSGQSASNRFTFMSNGKTYPRLGQPQVVAGAPDAHIYHDTNGADVTLSKVNSGYQAVQLNSYIAIRSNINFLIDRLFNMVPQSRD